MPNVSLEVLVKDVLQQRFPSDVFSVEYGGSWWAIYVNSICYISGRNDESSKCSFYIPGVKNVAEHARELNAADPKFFDKIKDLTIRNLMYYEKIYDRQTY